MATMESPASFSAAASAHARSHFDHVRWVIQVKTALETMDEEIYSRGPVSVFCVPRSSLSARPEAYTPQIIAIGPYHHWDPQLFQMEYYKLATAKRMQNQLLRHGCSFLCFVDYCAKKEHAIRSFYHRHIDLDAETLSWMMAIDASFLIEFLRTCSDAKGPSLSHMVIKLANHSILRDIAMLENQIPLFLVRKLLLFQCSSKQAAEEELSKMLVGFLKVISPFKATQSLASIGQPKQYAHLLQLLYFVIVDKVKDNTGTAASASNEFEFIENDAIESNNNPDRPDSEYTTKVLDSVWSFAAGLHFVNLLAVKPIEFLLRVPWPMVTSFFRGERRSYDPLLSEQALADEIDVPSVAELVKAGVKFSAAEGYLQAIEFDARTATLRLPAIGLDGNTETVMRNLVAYETAAEVGPLVFTRYTELMNGIIDRREDVQLLRQTGVMTHRRMKSDEAVAKMWNGMGRSARMAKVEFLDKVIAEVNGYYDSRWGVKVRRLVRNYVNGSWQFLTFVAVALLLLMTCVDAFCSVFPCSSRWWNLA